MSRKRDSCNCDYGSYGTPHEAFGSYYGGRAGSFLGAAAARGVGKIFGWGDYEIKTNSLVKGGGLNSGLELQPLGDKSTRIRYREYLGDVFTSATPNAFLTATYPINPGQISTFPWLSPIAQQYDQWQPMGIVFEFRSTSSDYAATQALGSVIMATEYDSLDATFTNKQEMLNCAYSQEAKPTERALHGVECDPGQNPQRIYYTRGSMSTTGTPILPTGASIRDYDLGNFVIATQGCPTASLNLGSLYVYYDIIFRKEQIYNGIPSKGPLNWHVTMTGTINGANPLGTTAFTQNYGNLTAQKGGSANIIQLPPWTAGSAWRLILMWAAGAGWGHTNPLITFTGATSATTTFDGQTTWQSAENGATSDTLIMIVNCYQTASAATIIVGTAGTLTGVGGQANLSQISSAWETTYS